MLLRNVLAQRVATMALVVALGACHARAHQQYLLQVASPVLLHRQLSPALMMEMERRMEEQSWT